MRVRERLSLWLRPLVALGHNPLTLFGAGLTTAAGLTMVGFWMMDLLFGGAVSPYAGIVLFLILPGVFVFGLLLIPIGVLWRHLRARKQGASTALLPRLSWSDPTIRRGLALVAVATAVNIVIISAATYRGVVHMDSVQFCGQTCHTVMQPQFTAFHDSPHSRIECVSCHIGSGAPWFVRSKLSGTRQIFAVFFKTYSRPIPSPVRHLRPARETCEHCHWPARFVGDRFIVRTHFGSDEHNTPLTTVLVLKVGGSAASGRVGIHGRHIDTRARITYTATDERRLTIARVRYVADGGENVEYVNAQTAGGAARETRQMDCMDCHNRPSHTFELPEVAVDNALADGRIDRALPFVKKKAVEWLRASYPSRDAALAQIPQTVSDYYRTTYAQVYGERRAAVDAAGQALAGLYGRNVFPEMNVTWGTYPNHVGHQDYPGYAATPGCFRCHDGEHTTADGRTITQDCEACHTILAQDESNPEILAKLGLRPTAQ